LTSISFVFGLDTEKTIPYVDNEIGAEDMIVLVKFRFSSQNAGAADTVGLAVTGEDDGVAVREEVEVIEGAGVCGDVEDIDVVGSTDSLVGTTGMIKFFSSPSFNVRHSVFPVAGSTGPPSGNVN
jgi:hypothetical protein